MYSCNDNRSSESLANPHLIAYLTFRAEHSEVKGRGRFLFRFHLGPERATSNHPCRADPINGDPDFNTCSKLPPYILASLANNTSQALTKASGLILQRQSESGSGLAAITETSSFPNPKGEMQGLAKTNSFRRKSEH